jgi:tetratricopeptide (TPR) repeat protein
VDRTSGDIVATTDAAGAYSFLNLAAGSYALRAKQGDLTTVTTIQITGDDTRSLDLTLSGASSAKPPEFFDEPQFTVAGVTQGTTYGGHGSDNVSRASEALVKETGKLGKDSAGDQTATRDSANVEKLRRERDDLQSLIRRDENLRDETAQQQQAARHHQLAGIFEKLNEPVNAVREYQRAAELVPNETHLFDWASELLTHRAPEPATEVFAQGNRLYPQSVRMLVGLGISWYARRSYERASQFLVAASDLAPSDPTPYIFMGKMESVETVPASESVKRLERFVSLAPDNALANYYYALGLWKQKQPAGAIDPDSSAKIEALLQKAVKIDPNMGTAHLQLGALYARRGDEARALAAYEKAVAVSPELEEAHYRLAQTYRRAGKEAEAQRQMQLHTELAAKSKEESDRQRREIQQFVVSMRD